MAQSFTSYKLENDEQFKAQIQRAIEITGDLKIPFGLILADFYKSEQAIFKLKSAGAYPDFTENGREVGLKSKYAQRKIKERGFAYPLLLRTGKLAASVLGRYNPGSVAQIGSLSMTWGTTIPYGIYHQSDEARHKIPLRKFLFIGGESSKFDDNLGGRAKRWQLILQDHIVKQLKRDTMFK